MTRKTTLCVVLSLSFFGYACGQYDASKSVITDVQYSDGPYISIQDDTLTVDWVCNNQSQSEQVSLLDFPYHFEHCGLNAKLSDLNIVPQSIAVNGDFTVAAISDLHGQYDLAIELLQNNKIIDANNRWQFAENHLVITGDIFDRGDKQMEILWFLYELEKQALAAGGNVHLLLGNHEVMVLNARLDYLHQKYFKVADILGTLYPNLFSERSVQGKWLRSKNVLANINGNLFLHAGLHPKLAEEGLSLSAINQLFKDHLVKHELEAPRTGLAKFLHTRDGVIWYRGYFSDIRATSEEIDTLLTHFDINRIIVGHTSQEQVETRYEGRVIAIDAGMKRGKNGEILFIDKNVVWRGNLNGEKLPL